MYIPRVLAGTCVLAGMCGLSIHIYTSVGLSALLVSICRAMREPFYRGTSNRNRSTLFCLCMINEETRTAIAGAAGHTNRNNKHMAQGLNVGSYLQNGKYRIIGMLGQGGFGITYLAVQSGLERKVAIKEFFMKELCNRDGSTSHVTLGTEGSRETVARFREKFLKEARNIARLNHPHIVRIHDIFEENGTAYYVMEYAEGGSLADLLKRKGCLSEPDATRYIFQVAEALAYIHAENMNHLDVKPANILLNGRNEAILIDFGLSKQYDALTGGQTSTTPVGTSEGYAPMEQYKQGGVSEFSPETDIYALGATFFKLLTGKTPPSASDVFEDGVPVDELKARGVSQEAIWVIKNAMEPKKKDRMKDVRLFINGLGEAKSKSKQPQTVVPEVNNEDTRIETVGGRTLNSTNQSKKTQTSVKRRKRDEQKNTKKLRNVFVFLVIFLALLIVLGKYVSQNKIAGQQDSEYIYNDDDSIVYADSIDSEGNVVDLSSQNYTGHNTIEATQGAREEQKKPERQSSNRVNERKERVVQELPTQKQESPRIRARPASVQTQETETVSSVGNSNSQNNVANASSSSESVSADEFYNRIYEGVVGTPAHFPGGVEACMKWLSEHLRYPASCQVAGIQGRVIVEFVVEKDGSITDVDVKSSPDDLLSKEAVRVVRAMPKWAPAFQDGHRVRQRINLPILFHLTEE